MAYLLSPLFQDAQFDEDGAPLVGGKLAWYQAGTTTPATVYTDATGATSHANPIVLNARGEPASPIYLDDAISYKAVLSDADDVTVRTIDGIEGISSPSGDAQSEWVTFAGAPTYVDADEFSVAGDQTAAFHVGRRVRLAYSGGYLYGTIAASTFASATTIRVTLDSGSLDGTLTTVAYSVLSFENHALPLNLPVLSGTYTPSGYAGTNVTSVVPGVCNYSRVGNVVTVSGIVTVDTTAIAASVFQLSLPIASDFTTATDASGTFMSASNVTGGIVYGVTSDRLECLFYAVGTFQTAEYRFIAQYIIK